MNPCVRSQPSPTHDHCDYVARVRAAVERDDDDRFRSGANPPGTGGTRNGTA